jgi:hypothetical protein
MTICIAAIAGRGDQIVCVADKMMSLGDMGSESAQWDSNVTKMFPLTKDDKVVCLFAGAFGICELLIDQLTNMDKLGEDPEETRIYAETAYGKLFEKYQLIDILKQRGINQKTYEAIIKSGNDGYVIRDIYQEMSNYVFDCDIMLCGYDKKDLPFIISVAQPGKASNHMIDGSYAIGVGTKTARSRLLWSEFNTNHSFGRVLFDCFDAKATAEMIPGIGREWDSYILFRNEATREVPKIIKRDLIEAGWDNHFKSPFEEWNEEEYLPHPGEGWEKRILELSFSDLDPIS